MHGLVAHDRADLHLNLPDRGAQLLLPLTLLREPDHRLGQLADLIRCVPRYRKELAHLLLEDDDPVSVLVLCHESPVFVVVLGVALVQAPHHFLTGCHGASLEVRHVIFQRPYVLGPLTQIIRVLDGVSPVRAERAVVKSPRPRGSIGAF